MEVEMEIAAMLPNPMKMQVLLILRRKGGKELLPIDIGVMEATAILTELEKKKTPRPMTHDSWKNTIEVFGGQLTKVVITDIVSDEQRRGTYLAELHFERDGDAFTQDARPSDAIALALRFACPIFVEEDVLQKAKAGPEGEGAESGPDTQGEFGEWLEKLGKKPPDQSDPDPEKTK